MSPADETHMDGRSQRRTQNTDAVVDVMLDLLASGNPWPSAAQVAERAGLSERSVFRYFADLDALARAAVDRQVERANPLFLPLPDDGTLSERIDRLVDHRLAMFDQVGAIVYAARLRAAMYEAIAQGLAFRRSQMRRQLKGLFPEELDGDDDRLVALEVATGLETLQSLRVDRGLSKPRTARILRRSIEALLTA